MLWVVAIATMLVLVTLFVHYEALHRVSVWMPKAVLSGHASMLVVVTAAVFAHLIEIGIYAGCYYLMESRLDLGRIGGDVEGNWLDYFYFSMAMYTTLGVGDLLPRGPMRLVSGIESLVGLLMITWSASFTYAWRERLHGD